MPSYKLIVNNAKVILKTMANYVINLTGIKDNLTGTSNVTNGKIDWTLQEFTNTASWFTTNNPVLLLGQKGIETDDLLTAPKFKIGNGVTAWNSLPYFSSGSSTTPTLQEVTDEGATTTNQVNFNGLTDGLNKVYINPLDNAGGQVVVKDNANQEVVQITGDSGLTIYDSTNNPLFTVDRTIGLDQAFYKNVEVATVNDIPTVDTTIIDGSTNPIDGNAVFDALATKYSKGCTLVFTHATLNPSDGVSYFFGCFVANSANNTSTTLRRGFAPLTGHLFNGIIHAQVASTLGSTETATFEINNITQGTSSTLSTTVKYDVISAGFPFELVTPFAVNSGDALEIKVTMPTFVTNPVAVIHLVTLIFGVK
jgi:hypothetical protein